MRCSWSRDIPKQNYHASWNCRTWVVQWMNGPGGRGFTRKTMDPISGQLLGVVLWRRCIPLASSTSSLAAAQGTSNDARGRTRRPELCWLDAFRPSLIMPLSSPSSFRSSPPPRIASVSPTLMPALLCHLTPTKTSIFWRSCRGFVYTSASIMSLSRTCRGGRSMARVADIFPPFHAFCWLLHEQMGAGVWNFIGFSLIIKFKKIMCKGLTI